MQVVADSGMRLEPWTGRGSTEMLSIFRRAPGAAAKLIASVASQQAPRTSPQRFIHALIGLDPDLAAALTAEMVAQGLADAGPRALLELAYDAYWTELRAGPGVEPALGARFLARLARIKGDAWLDSAYGQTLALVRGWAAAGEIEPDFESELRRTLAQATRGAASVEARAVAERLAKR